MLPYLHILLVSLACLELALPASLQLFDLLHEALLASLLLLLG
jgi:hypothetical protein